MAGPIPGTEQQIPAGGDPAMTGAGQGGPEDAGAQLTQLVGGVSQGISTLRSLMEATPDAPEEAKVLLDQSLDAFMQSMNLMVGGTMGEDEAAAEQELPSPQASLAQQPAIRPKNMGTL